MSQKPADPPPAAPAPQPRSLEGHQVPPERLDLIVAHVAVLAETALAVGNALPLSAAATDFVRVLETEGR